MAPLLTPVTANDGAVLSIFSPVSVPRPQFGVAALSHTSGDCAVTFDAFGRDDRVGRLPLDTEPGSIADQSIRTLSRYQPAPFGRVVALPVTTGGGVAGADDGKATGVGDHPSATPSASPMPPSVSVMSTWS